MSFFDDIIFKIVEEYDCPLYDMGEQFNLTHNILSTPKSKKTCIILVKDVIEFIDTCKNIENSNIDYELSEVFLNCTGCTGMIRLECNKDASAAPAEGSMKDEKVVANIARMLSNFSMFQTLESNEIKDLISFLKLKQFNKGDIIIKKGDPGKYLFIILSGKVEVLSQNNVSIALLSQGEIFGEMSLLSGDPVTATIKVIDPVKLLFLNSKDFRKVLHKYPSLQMYLARLLSQRLARTNNERTEELSAVMSGSLSETPPSELFQTFNMNEKTGTLTLNLENGDAELAFKKGNLVGAKYKNKEDKEAFFELLKQKDGRYKFIPGLSSDKMKANEVGHFMCLLMEGLSRMDEEEYELKRKNIN